MDHPVVTL